MRVGDMLGCEYEIVIGKERLRTGEKIESLNPARPGQLVGLHQKSRRRPCRTGDRSGVQGLPGLAVRHRRRARDASLARCGDHSRPEV